MIDELKTVLSTVTDLPPMPPVASQVMALLQGGSATARELAKAISSDPAVAAQVLKIANSAFYSLPRQVKTLDHAIVVMGDAVLRSLVMASCLRGVNRSFGPVEKMLWEDAMGCGVAARLLASRLASADPEEAFLGGLFRNLGKLVMNNLDPLKYRLMVEDAGGRELSWDELEQRYFPFSHALLGAAVLAKWKFPENLTYVVRYYRSLVRTAEDSAVEGLLGTVNIADDFCRRRGIGRVAPEACPDWGAIPGAQLLGVAGEGLAPIYDEFVELFERDRAAVLP